MSSFMRFWLGIKKREFNELRANGIFDWRGFFFCYQLALCISGKKISDRDESLINKLYSLVVFDNYRFDEVSVGSFGWLNKVNLLKVEFDRRVLGLFSPVLSGFEHFIESVLGEFGDVDVLESKDLVGGFENLAIHEGPIL